MGRDDRIHQIVQHTRLGPTVEDGGSSPVALRQIDLGRARMQVMKDTIQHRAVIDVKNGHGLFGSGSEMVFH